MDANTLIRWFLRINRPELETVCLQMTDVIGHLRRPDDGFHKSISDNTLRNVTSDGCTNGCRMPIPEDLRRVIESWDDLPPHVKASICQLCNVPKLRPVLTDS